MELIDAAVAGDAARVASLLLRRSHFVFLSTTNQSTQILGRPFFSLSRNGRFSSRPPPQNPGIVATASYQPWRPTAALVPPLSHLHWRDHAMIRQSLHSPPHWGPQFLDPDIFRTESPSSTVRHKSPSQQILKTKHVLESQGDVLESLKVDTQRKFSSND